MHFESLTGFPPFAGSTVDETWKNLKHWREVLKRPVWEDPNYFISNRTWNFITSCITSKIKRFSNISEVYGHHVLRSSLNWIPKLTRATLMISATKLIWLSTRKSMTRQTALENMADREDAMSKSLFVGFTFRHRKPNTDDDGKASLQEKPSQLTALLGLCYEPIMILMIITTFDSIFDLGR
ncbi:hypothetical protein EYC84_001024 [Monilinia fructicola]|uniref:Protein kinase domain-containing protein n=1 Tax=Monilinia fructicola TaxID=38448 RepID=A0A5M9JIQ9_MONFR|nr:hypothetical protein EYC84_001024 [Monilinia fructicola]